MKLHEIELYSDKPDEAKEFYASTLGLKLQVDQQALKVFDSGIPGVDLNISNHYPANKVSLSFLVKDVDAYIAGLKDKNIELQPFQSHLGLRAVALVDNIGCRIVVQSPTEESPEWLRNMV